MIKALLHSSDGQRKLLVLGFSGMNAEKLFEGLPILADLSEAGIEGLELLVMHGKTERSIMDEIEKKLGIKLPSEVVVRKVKAAN